MKICEICSENAVWVTSDGRSYCWDCVMGFGISATHLEDNRTPTHFEIQQWFEKQEA